MTPILSYPSHPFSLALRRSLHTNASLAALVKVFIDDIKRSISRTDFDSFFGLFFLLSVLTRVP